MDGSPSRPAIAFYGYLSALLSLLIVTAALVWLIYISLPIQYYVPASLVMLGLFGALCYVVLSRRILTESKP